MGLRIQVQEHQTSVKGMIEKETIEIEIIDGILHGIVRVEIQIGIVIGIEIDT